MLNKNFAAKLIITILFLLLITACALTMTNNNFQAKQEALAKVLNVKINDYPDTERFPLGYYESVLVPGMSVHDVHALIKGYDIVYNCYGTDELYYYFSKDENDAVRFKIYYSTQQTYENILGEDNNSRTLSVGECIKGPLPE